MQPTQNPYAPGAGTPPPALTGRDPLRTEASDNIECLKRGRSADNIVLIGLRGVGKTVLLNRMLDDIESGGASVIHIEATEKYLLHASLAHPLYLALLQLNRIEAAKDAAARALRALTDFASRFKLSFADVQVSLTPASAHNTSGGAAFEFALCDLLEQAGKAARSAGTALVIFIDELQCVDNAEMSALVYALHRCSQRQLPVAVIAAGLPQSRALVARAKSYAERMFRFVTIDSLSDHDARQAIVQPAEEEGVAITQEAVDLILAQSAAYPYFLQAWGKSAWSVATHSPITEDDVILATRKVIAGLDESFYRVRFDQLTTTEKQYLRAMAELGEGPHQSIEVAELLGRTRSAVEPVRNELIRKGMIWSPVFEDAAFTVPLFHDFMKRILPGVEWRCEIA